MAVFHVLPMKGGENMSYWGWETRDSFLTMSREEFLERSWELNHSSEPATVVVRLLSDAEESAETPEKESD